MLTLRGPKEPRRGSALNQLSIIPDGSLLIRDGILVEVGPTRRVENLALARQAIEVSAAGRVVMPGFVDSHTHLLFPPPGTVGLHALTGMWLKARARSYLEAMARHGTTMIEVKTGYGPDESAEMKILRVLAALKEELVEVLPSVLFRLPAVVGCAEDVIQNAKRWMCHEFLPKVRRRRLACFADTACNSQDCLTAYFEAARSLGLMLKVHADYSTPLAAVAEGVEYGAVSIDHLEYATADEAALLAASTAIATLVPGASFHGDGRFAPARMLIEVGVPIALATNFNPHHTPTLSMQTVVGLACRYLGMTAAEAISAATINGAYALGRAATVGSLEYGKTADLIMLNTSDYRDLACGFGTDLVHTTMKRGEFIYEEGEVAPRPAEDLRPSW